MEGPEWADAGADVDWALVDATAAGIKISASIARVELGSVQDKVNAEKKKLKALAAKHKQACEELTKARRAVQNERGRLMEQLTKLEHEMGNLAGKQESGGELATHKNQLQVEIAQAKRKIETKRVEHEKYLTAQAQTMK
ncbi:unnamed protein product, partial [Durusdinium trenchii]